MKLKLFAIVALAIASSTSLGAAEKVTTGTINVISTTPLPSIGLPMNIIPANIQIVNRADLKNQAGVSIVDFANNNLQGVSIQETQGNPFQPDVTFRGYSASPLGGSPQGISVFLDGVRMNEPFGDTVRWDLIPTFAIQGMQMVPGSNPVYGLNTLGGAIAIQTKSGRLNQGAAIEASAGSWGRKNVSAEYGGVSKDGSVDYFLGVNYLDENGWRKYSPTTVKQTFAKVGWQSESTKIDLSFLGINNDMIGNGLVPQEIMTGLGRDAIHTRPDQTRNSLSQITLNGSHWLNNDVMFSANTYYRRSNQKTLNGDVNDNFDNQDTNLVCGSTSGDVCEQAVFNKTRTISTAAGISAQLAFNQNIFNKKNQLIVGTGFDRSMSKYGQFEQEFNSWDSSRYPAGGAADDQETSTNFMGKTTSSNIFATDTLSINELVHVTAGLRYNYSKVNNKDFLVGTDGHGGDAGGRHTFSRVNPSLGLTLTPNQNISIYGSYSESNRAPTAMELACADPANPCLLPNAMASDPPLKQVVAKTYDLGAKGNLSSNVKWNASIYHAVNHNDLQFIHSANSNNTSLGYFDNVGKTQRQGLDLGLSGNFDKLTLTGSYGFVKATYEDSFTLTSEGNSTGETSGSTRVIEVTKGNYLAGIPKHQFKLRAQYEVIPAWTVGANLVAFSSRYMHGNENNKHQANSAACDVASGDGDEITCGKGKTGGYAIVNLDTQYNAGGGWKIFAKAINIFDKDYETTGRLGASHFGSTGIWADDTTGTRLVAPGAPRAGWIGVRYEFGGAPESK